MAPQPAGRCSICGRPSEHDYRPFCSRRCADVDLSRWLRGAYSIPSAAETEDGDGAAKPASGAGGEAGLDPSIPG